MKIRSKSYLLAAAVFLAVLSAGCGTADSGEADKGPQRTIVDEIGRSVTVPANVDRVVSLAPNLTETVFALGAGDKLVGVTTFCNFPAETLGISKVGDTLKPNIERIVEMKPQVVLVSTASQLEAFTGVLDRQGISVFVTSPNSLEDVYRSIEKIGDLLGRRENAAGVIQKMKRRVEAVRGKVMQRNPVRVFVQIDKSLYTIGRESYITDLVAIAGGKSVTDSVETAYPRISRESARALDPEVIILSESPDNDKPNDVFADSNAVRNGRIARIDADVLSRPGPRIADAIERIAEALHRGNE